MAQPSARERFFDLLRTSVNQSTLLKATLGKPTGAEPELKNVFVRPVTLKAGPHLSFVYRYATRDVTKNFLPEEALAQLENLVGRSFLDAHVFTPTQVVQLSGDANGSAKLRIKGAAEAPAAVTGAHDRAREHLVAASAPWLRELGVTNERGQILQGMAPKYRQINRFVELFSHLADEAGLAGRSTFSVADMGCGKGYLTLGVAAFFSGRAEVLGIEARPELVELCGRVASRHGLQNARFAAGTIAEATLPSPLDALVALHACDTATDDALARGISAGAKLLLVSPCCQKELRPQLAAPPVLRDALKHGIFQERQAEFVTDALRAQLLEWRGYRTKVFEFISTEHTAKNLMIAAVKTEEIQDHSMESRIRAFAHFYGIKRQRLAQHLGFDLAGG